MPFIPFPNVPAVAGVPQLPFQAFAGGFGAGVVSVGASVSVSNSGVQVGGSVSVGGITLLSADDPSISGVLAAPEWGIFDASGNPVAVADSVLKLDFSLESAICDYPVEQGGFGTYNKVRRPYDFRLSMTKGGSTNARQAFLVALIAAEKSLTSYQVRMPEGYMPDCQVTRVELQRSATEGAQLLTVEVSLRQIRIAGSSTFSNTAAPSGAAQSNGGTVQAQTPTAGQATVAAGGAH